MGAKPALKLKCRSSIIIDVIFFLLCIITFIIIILELLESRIKSHSQAFDLDRLRAGTIGFDKNNNDLRNAFLNGEI
jgi:hypothetical protein